MDKMTRAQVSGARNTQPIRSHEPSTKQFFRYGVFEDPKKPRLRRKFLSYNKKKRLRNYTADDVVSKRPKIVEPQNIACQFNMSEFGLGKRVNTDIQCDNKGIFYLQSWANMREVAQYKNPAKDPLEVGYYDFNNSLHLIGGFHRLFELQRRDYTGNVWCIVSKNKTDVSLQKRYNEKRMRQRKRKI